MATMSKQQKLKNDIAQANKEKDDIIMYYNLLGVNIDPLRRSLNWTNEALANKYVVKEGFHFLMLFLGFPPVNITRFSYFTGTKKLCFETRQKMTGNYGLTIAEDFDAEHYNKHLVKFIHEMRGRKNGSRAS